MERHAEDLVPYKMGENELEKIFSSNGVPDEKMEMFEDAYRENIGNVPVMASNICDNKVVNIQVPEGKITIDVDPSIILKSKKLTEENAWYCQ